MAVHDSSHFEVKLDYSIDSHRKKNRYRVASYFFIPRTLGINKHTYPREQFFSDVQAYIRFKTPSMALNVLSNPDDALSPLSEIRDALLQLDKTPGDKPTHDRLFHEMRLFGCIARSKLRDRAKSLRSRTRALPVDFEARPVLFEDLQKSWRKFLNDLSEVIAAWRMLRSDVVDDSMPALVREAYLYVDEYLSLQVEDKLTDLVREIDNRPSLLTGLEAERTRAREAILAEQRHRSGAGYPSVVQEGTENEHFLFRQSLLKKFVMSVLWLEISKEKESGAGNLGAAIAAGLAMAMALAVTILQMQWFLNTTWTFIIAGTITYILKDRIKEWLKHYFSSRFTRWIPDYSVRIRDPATGRDIGRCGESFHYVSAKDVPDEVLALRRKGNTSSIEEMAKPEIVLKYEKDVELNGDALSEQLEDYDINDIMRFGVSSLFVRADDPRSAVSVFQRDTNRVEKWTFPRVYHLNVVLVLESLPAKARPVMKRLRVVFDKDGIRRLEHVA